MDKLKWYHVVSFLGFSVVFGIMAIYIGFVLNMFGIIGVLTISVLFTAVIDGYINE